MPQLRRLAVAVLLAGSLAACSSNGRPESTTSPGPTATASDPCPVTPVDVVASVDQWGVIASALGGGCAKVTSVLSGSSVDPHDFEPSPANAVAFTDAQLVVINGADYDPWARKLAETSAPQAAVVDAAEVAGAPAGANPHLWYKPAAVAAVADAVTARLTTLSAPAADYFAKQRAAFAASLEPYTSTIDRIKSSAGGRSYVATEGVFDYMADALGLVNRTPAGYRNAIANESDPSPADLDALRRVLSDRQADVLIYNTQTEGSVPEQIRAAAQEAGVPIVDITETVPPGQGSFGQWQVGQLTALAKALGVGV